MSKKREKETLAAIISATSNFECQIEALEVVSNCMDRAFKLMNLYAQDPHEMGEKGRFSRTDPQAVLAEVYFILAPAQQTMMELFGDPTYHAIRDRTLNEMDSEIGAHRKKINAEKSKLGAEAKKHAKEVQQRLHDLDQMLAEREQEVKRYLCETERNTRSVQRVARREIEL